MVVFLGAVIIIVCPRLLPLVSQAFTSAAVQKPAAVLPPPGVKYLALVEDLLFDLTNQARRSHGVAPLVKDEELRQVARAYSNDMLIRGFFEHTTPDGVPFHRRISKEYHHWVFVIGENIWHDDSSNPEKSQKLAKEIFDDLMESPDHRENLLDPDYTNLGVGVSALHQRVRATQEFVKRAKFFSFGAQD